MRRWQRTTTRGVPRGGWYRALMRRRKARESRQLESLLRADEFPVGPVTLQASLENIRAKWLSANGRG